MCWFVRKTHSHSVLHFPFAPDRRMGVTLACSESRVSHDCRVRISCCDLVGVSQAEWWSGASWPTDGRVTLAGRRVSVDEQRTDGQASERARRDWPAALSLCAGTPHCRSVPREFHMPSRLVRPVTRTALLPATHRTTASPPPRHYPSVSRTRESASNGFNVLLAFSEKPVSCVTGLTALLWLTR